MTLTPANGQRSTEQLYGDYLCLEIPRAQFEEHVAPLYDAHPEGLVFHTTWTTADDEVRVYDVWSSEGAKEGFASRLAPALTRALAPALHPVSERADGSGSMRFKKWGVRVGAALHRQS